MNAKADFNMQIFDMGAKLIYSKQIPYACSVVSVEKSIFGKGLFIVSIQTMNKNFYQKHRDKLIEQNKENYQKKKEEIKEKQKELDALQDPVLLKSILKSYRL